MIDLSYCPQKSNVILRCKSTGQEIYTDDEIVFNYVRGQIARWEYNDWTVEYKGKIYHIDDKGQIPNWPSGLFDQNENLCSYILKHGICREAVHDLREELINIDVMPE